MAMGVVYWPSPYVLGDLNVEFITGYMSTSGFLGGGKLLMAVPSVV